MDKYLPLDKAAKQIGVSPKTLRRWLEKDLGLVFRNARFQRVLVSERDLQELIRRRTGKREWPGSRSKTEGEPQ